MLAAITAAVLVGKPFYPETRYVPEIQIAVNSRSRDGRERWESRVVLSELQNAAGEHAYYIQNFARVCVLDGKDVPLRMPVFRFGHNGQWWPFPRGTFAAPGTFTLTLYAEVRWRTWQAHCDEIRNGERRSYDGSWHSLPPPPDCWTPSGFDRKAILREVGIEDIEDRLRELLP